MHALCRRGLTPQAFTLVELLTVIAIVGLLAALLLPGLSSAKSRARRIACVSNLRQQALAWELYLQDHALRFPDRRDLKHSLPGGYKPWTTWPKSDPRSGWAAVVLQSLLPAAESWSCPSLAGSRLQSLPQAVQAGGMQTNAPHVRYWMWRFDRAEDVVAPDNLWGKTPDQAVADLGTVAGTNAPPPAGPHEIELVVDVYFPATVAGLAPEVSGHAAHPKGRNRLFLDSHTEFTRDVRLR